jgi:predicted phage terminase large subunit-like protein
VFPAWLLGRNPAIRIAVISHSQSLAREFAVKTQRLVMSDWYREAFPKARLATDHNGAMDFGTTLGGGRYAASLETGITGRGFDLIIVDDPLSAQNASSNAERDRVKDAFDGMIASRLDDPSKGAMIVVHQRLHEDDLSGHLLRRGGWTHLSLPLIAEERTIHGVGDGAWVRETGDVLLPDIYTFETIRGLRDQHGEAVFSTQYQQNPTVAEGDLIKVASIGMFEAPPPAAGRITFSIDTAVKCTEDSSFSVVLVIASDGHRHYLIDVLRERLEIVQMRDAVIGMRDRHGPAKILVEDASSGPGLVQMLREHGHPAELWPTRGRSKEQRLEAHLHMFAEGRVLVRHNQPWTITLLNEWAGFPGALHDDQVDAMTQYLDWFASSAIANGYVTGTLTKSDRAAAKIFGPPLRKGEHPMRPHRPTARIIRRW